ncbi:MAG: DUF6514 family protein [Bacillota bacterium]|nr:DUF6514 family protein [Bacillota bacterium]
MSIVENFCKTAVDGDKQYKYEYRMIKSNVLLSYGGDTIEVQSYGIEVERRDFVDGNMVSLERECVSNVSPQRHKVHNLLKMLFDNTVSPIHLVEVIGEYIDEYIVDFDEAYKEISNC